MTQSVYRADHVGSLLRPGRLLSARADFDEGRIGIEELRAAEDEAIVQALAVQREVGLPIYSDGEYRRKSFLSELAAAVDGFVDSHAVMPWRGDDSQPDKRSTSKVAGAKLRKQRRLTGHEVAFLAKHAPGPFKATIPELSYFTIASWQPGVSDTAYPRRIDLIDDLAAIQRSELTGMLADGVTYLQLDSVGYTTLIDQEHRDRVAGSGTDPDELIRACVAADQASLAELRREGVVIAMHMCRGNSRNRWLASGGYDRIAAQVFPHVPVDRWLLEYDTERAGGFEPLRHIPTDRTVVLGLVSTKSSQLEEPDELMRRVDEAAKYFPADNLAISPQCGFASIAEGNQLSWDDQRRKLELVVNTAARLWG